MSNLKDFILSSKNSNTTALVSRNIKSECCLARSANLLEISNSNENALSNELTNLAFSDDFLEHLSNNIADPKENETEEEFVNRAKKTMKNLLFKALLPSDVIKV